MRNESFAARRPRRGSLALCRELLWPWREREWEREREGGSEKGTPFASARAGRSYGDGGGRERRRRAATEQSDVPGWLSSLPPLRGGGGGRCSSLALSCSCGFISLAAAPSFSDTNGQSKLRHYEVPSRPRKLPPLERAQERKTILTLSRRLSAGRVPYEIERKRAWQSKRKDPQNRRLVYGPGSRTLAVCGISFAREIDARARRRLRLTPSSLPAALVLPCPWCV